MEKILVVGSNGATGRLVVAQLLEQNVDVVAILRPSSQLPEELTSHNNLTVIRAEISELKQNDLIQHLDDCTGVICCLGHNLTFRGVYGQPRLLVTDTIKNICHAIEYINGGQFKLILMNTTGNSNHDLLKKPPLSQRIVISIIRLLLPPHVDNEKAADFLHLKIGQTHQLIEWTAVRPDGLIDEESVSQYEIHTSPTRNAIFDAGVTSRINVANFMSRLICENELWTQWKGKMPVIYNQHQK